MGRLLLKDVTLCAVDGPCIDLTLEALSRCQEQATFPNTLLFSEIELGHIPGINIHTIPKLGTAQKSGMFFVSEVHKHVSTSHVLKIEWDSWIIHPEMWTDKFLQYDYIGARWPEQPEKECVGNSGFWLISKRLLRILSTLEFPETGAMDVDISKTLRPWLEETHEIKFAPSRVADDFAYERVLPSGPTFGFHGMFHFWRYLSDDQIVDMLPIIPDSIVRRGDYKELMKVFFDLRKFKIARFMQKRFFECQKEAA